MLAFIIMLLVTIPLTFLRGWVFIMLWSWFVTPVFNLPMLNMPVSIGLCTIIAYFTSVVGLDTATLKLELLGKSQTKVFTETVISSIIWSLMALGTGYVAHLFM